VIEAFTIQLGQFQGMLRASLNGITVGDGNTRMLDAQAGTAVVVVADE